MNLDPLRFDLAKVLDPLRDDYKIVNPNYKNVVIFTYKNAIGNYFAFSFCTLLFYEVTRFEVFDHDYIGDIIKTVICFKHKKTLHGQIPGKFVVYNYSPKYRDFRKDGVNETMKFFDFEKPIWA